jgi:RNA polymerase sigma-70 factor (ECF subfamily)
MGRSAEERFNEIYAQHAQAVSAFVRRRAPAELVDDIVAETFVVCWRRLDRVPAEPLPWLYVVARKTLANERRKAGRKPPIELATEQAPFEHDPSLGLAFHRLSERDREVLRLIAWDCLTLHEAAAVLRCSPVACRVRFHRAKTRLAARLDELEAPPLPKSELKGAIQ